MRLIFVGGCERSGTTLVQKILLTHSQIIGGPEFIFTRHIAELYHKMAADYPEHYKRRIQYFYTQEQLSKAFKDFYIGLLESHFPQTAQTIYFSEKTPSNIFAAPILLHLFPDSLFVHIIRDGRDVLVSHKHVLKRIKASNVSYYNQKAFRWWRICRRWNHAVHQHFDLLNDTEIARRYFWLKYEDLLQRPEQVLSELFGFLDLAIEPSIFNPAQTSKLKPDDVVDNFWHTHSMYEQGFNTDKIFRYRQDLSLTQQWIAGAFLAANLKRLDYPIDPSLLSIGKIFKSLPRTRLGK